MIFSAPWAWIGALAIAVPIAIHLLTRQRARPLPFPTLRFLKGATVTAARQRRLRDGVLLIVRCATLLAVVAAGGGPILRAVRGPSPAATTLRRAVVIDTSVSMTRKSADGRTGIDVARARAAALTPAADATRTIELDRLDAAVDRTSAWLDAGPGRRELVVLSDFQRGALNATGLGALPSSDGIQLIRVDLSPAPVVTASVGVGSRTLTARAVVDGDATSVAWRNAFAAPPLPVQILSKTPAPRDVEAAVEAAQSQGLPTGTAVHAIAIVSPEAGDLAQRVASTQPIDRPWMSEAIALVAADERVRAAAVRTTASVDASALSVAARDRTGRPALVAGVSRTGGAERLELFVLTTDPLLLSATIASASRAAVAAPEWSESEPAVLSDAELSRWNRATPATAPISAGDDGRSDARWCWALALVLILGESALRRSPRPGPVTEAADDRVA
jgi:hypothetical protein